jgi:hypothetical protein
MPWLHPDAPKSRRPHEALARVLDTDTSLAATLHAFGVTTATASLVVWLPALELAWAIGCDSEAAARIRGTVTAHQRLTDAERRLLEDWLTRRPAEALFRAARLVTVQQTARMWAGDRDAVLRAVLSACALSAVAQAAGGLEVHRNV